MMLRALDERRDQRRDRGGSVRAIRAAQERERVSTIHGLADKLQLERGFADDLIKRGVSIDEARRLTGAARPANLACAAALR